MNVEKESEGGLRKWNVSIVKERKLWKIIVFVQNALGRDTYFQKKKMQEKDRFQGSYKTMRTSYKEFNGLCALWFSFGFKNSYKITKEKYGNKDYFVIWKDDNKVFKKILIK